jgi:two-component system, sensor histidine kinase PdtaS
MQSVLVKLLPKKRVPRLVSYAATVALILVAAGLRLLLGGPLHNYPLLLFFPAVFAAALFFDRGSGYLATLLSALITGTMVLAPVDGPAFRPEQLVPLAIFLLVGGMMTWIIQNLRHVVQRLAAAEQAKSLLLQELAHRTKNNLAIIASALRLQIRSVKSRDAQAALESALARVEAIAKAQDRLRDDASAGLVHLPDYLDAVCAGLHTLFGEVRPITVKVSCEPLRLAASKAVAVGLIVNELVVNSLKYAFPDGRPGTVAVEVVQDEAARLLRVRVHDDGAGGPVDSDSGLGSRLVQLLARQHGGDVERRSGAFGYEVRATLALDSAPDV